MNEDLKPDVESTEETTALVASPATLSEESMALINQIVAATDEKETKDLTHLFNLNQHKKTLARVNKLSDVQDMFTEQLLKRISSRPDEISNKEMLDGMKIIQDLIERGQKQATNIEETPLIQINQQNNEVNVGGTDKQLSRDSRERVKHAVMGLLSSLSNIETQNNNTDFIEVEEFKENPDGQEWHWKNSW